MSQSRFSEKLWHPTSVLKCEHLTMWTYHKVLKCEHVLLNNLLDDDKCARIEITIYNESRGWAPRKRNLPASVENNGSENQNYGKNLKLCRESIALWDFRGIKRSVIGCWFVFFYTIFRIILNRKIRLVFSIQYFVSYWAEKYSLYFSIQYFVYWGRWSITHYTPTKPPQIHYAPFFSSTLGWYSFTSACAHKNGQF